MVSTYNERIIQDIFQVEARLQKEFFKSSQAFDNLIRPLAMAGGKRLRAKLCLLIAGTVPSEENRVAIATAIEMLHLATLIHDDVLDQADLRRGIHTIHCSTGNKTAILSGDYLFAKTFALIAQTENIDCLRIFTRVIIALVEGEFFQMEDVGTLEQSKERYLLKIQKKTADFLEAATELGAILGNYSNEEVALFKKFGHAVGMLFQITDDVMDYCGTPEESGKPAGQDLREGVITFPLLAVTTDENRAYLQEKIHQIMAGESPTPLIEYVVEHGGIKATLALAAEYAVQARNALDALPVFEGKTDLYATVDGLVDRHI